MKLCRALLIALPLLASAGCGAVEVFSDRLTVYRCPSKNEAMSCKKCIQLKDNSMFNQVQFQINVAKSTVVSHRYRDEILYASRTEDHCKVISKKNWVCGQDGASDAAGNFLESRMGMKNGVHYAVHVTRIKALPQYDVQAADYKIFMCAKSLAAD